MSMRGVTSFLKTLETADLTVGDTCTLYHLQIGHHMGSVTSGRLGRSTVATEKQNVPLSNVGAVIVNVFCITCQSW